MKRTSAATVLIVGLIGLVVGLLTDVWLSGAGHPALVPPITLSVTLALIGGVVVVLAWPIRRAVIGKAPLRIDAFRAARTAALAKACALAGALLTGFALGVLIFEVTRSVVVSSVWLTVFAVLGGGILLAGGLVAEWCCTLPPPSDEERRAPEPGASGSRA